MGRRKKGRFKSKAQARWAFANKKSFAKTWAHRNIRDLGKPFTKKLPNKVRKKK
jgi:hypothetical protein